MKISSSDKYVERTYAYAQRNAWSPTPWALANCTLCFSGCTWGVRVGYAGHTRGVFFSALGLLEFNSWVIGSNMRRVKWSFTHWKYRVCLGAWILGNYFKLLIMYILVMFGVRIPVAATRVFWLSRIEVSLLPVFSGSKARMSAHDLWLLVC